MMSHLRTPAADGQPSILRLSDVKAAGVVFALVFLTTYPVAVPFMIMSDMVSALRVSNAIALLLLFGSGFSLGRYAGRRAWLWGFCVALIGVALVSIAMALGG